VADSLADYLQRHPEMENRLTCGTSEAQVRFYTTDTAESFEAGGAAFFRGEVKAIHTDLKP
jgi:glutamate racemase